MINSSSATAAAYTPSWLVDKAKKKKAAAAPASTTSSTTTTAAAAAAAAICVSQPVAAAAFRPPHLDVALSPPPSLPAYTSSISVTRTSNNLTSVMVHRPPLSHSVTSTNVIAGHGHTGALSTTAAVQPSPVLMGRSPTIHKRVPIRMSPMIMPSKHHMNPQAAAFVPGRDALISGLDGAGVGTGCGCGGVDGQHGLEALPTSTADMEAKEELVQLQMNRSQTDASVPIGVADSSGRAGATSLAGMPVDSARFAAMSQQHTRPAAAAGVAATPKLEAAGPRSATHTTPALKPILLEHKSVLEILEISKQSALSVAAPAYVSKRTMSRLMLEKPSPRLLGASGDAAEENVDLMLEDLWCLYYMPLNLGKGVKNEDFNPLLVFRIDSIPTLWKVFNNIPTPTELQPSTLYLFRDGIDPKWEDAANCDGGIVKIKVGKNEIDEAWELLLCRTIGDSWSPTVRNTVNGVALKIREHACLLEVWVTKQTPELLKDIAELLQPLLGATFVTVYYTHRMMQERAQAAATLSEKQKKQQQQQQRRRY